YCQDNELSWVDWDRARDFEHLTDFVTRISALRREHPVFRRRRFFQGRLLRGSHVEDIAWLQPSGEPMTDEDWDNGYAKSLAVFLNGSGIPELDQRGERITDDSFLILLNGHHETLTFTMPDAGYGEAWNVVVDTAAPLLDLAVDEPRSAKAGGEIVAEARSVLVLRRAF
ncbi:MAG: isoamylase, partial [Frankiaceae bacterium]|nr:isoamylase [Frankiaceae bacterium]